jgi:thiol:disulfide interchange protein
MPPTDAGPTRRPPLALAAVAGVLLIARVVLGVTETRSAPERPSLVRWREAATGEAEARARRTFVLYDFSAEWCGPCKRLDQDVFAEPRAAAEINGVFVPVRVTDRQREEGRNPALVDSLQRRFAVNSFPTLVIVDPASGRFERQEGHASRVQTMEWLMRTQMAMGGRVLPGGLSAPPRPGRVDSVLTR